MPARIIGGTVFADLVIEILQTGDRVRFQANGSSMQPWIQDGDLLEIAPVNTIKVRRGDVVLVRGSVGLVAHRVIKNRRRNEINEYLIKGDCCAAPDGWFEKDRILGRAERLERANQRIPLTTWGQRYKARLWVAAAHWAPRFGWLPVRFRQNVKNILFGGLMPD